MVSATEYQRAVEAFAQEQYEEATRLFAMLVESRPADPNLRLWLASAQQQIGRIDLARDQYEVVLGLSGDPEILQTAQKALQRIDLEMGSSYEMPNNGALFDAPNGHHAQPSSQPELIAFDKPFDDLGNDFDLPLGDLPPEPLRETERFAFGSLEPLAEPSSNGATFGAVEPLSFDEPTNGKHENNFSFDLDQNESAAGGDLGEVFQADLGSSRPAIPRPAATIGLSALTEPPSGGFFADQPLMVKQGLAIGALTLTTVAAVNGAVYYAVLNSGLTAMQQQALQSAALIGGAGGAAGIVAATLAVSWLLNRSVARPIQQLQATARLVAEGDVNARFEPRSSDEVGRLAATFNKMAADLQRGISRAEEEMTRQQRDKEQLQEEIIHLLDQVEGASRGDLTVKAEVSASLTGAVADAFNVTIASLRKIIVQVKQSVQKVNQAAVDSEGFARGLSKDALRQAEDISKSRDSVQQMLLSIQQVAANARRAETVARQASATATRGGESVDRTVQGILSLRETVSETGKKVKRLAEATQEISKIVALINQLSSRTNLLALNASIEAVRAGEAGRGFAIVADEVRQLADRAAKATREIEQIVLNIQSETGAVMQAMEKGTQQVIVGTQLAEEAKHSLDEIIQVSLQIDHLVAEIAQETVEQENTSRAVAEVMETVEKTAQTTSSESRRVSDALQGLVAVAQDLREATDRFQVETDNPV